MRILSALCLCSILTLTGCALLDSKATPVEIEEEAGAVKAMTDLASAMLPPPWGAIAGAVGTAGVGVYGFKKLKASEKDKLLG